MVLITNMRPIEFTGLAKLLGVPIVEENDKDAEDLKERYKPRDFTDVLSDIMEKFDKLNRKSKRSLLKLIQKSNEAH